MKRADDEIRTRDIHLGKVVLYQLSYVRIIVCNSPPQSAFPRVPTSKNSIGGSGNLQIGTTTADAGSAASLSLRGSY